MTPEAKDVSCQTEDFERRVRALKSRVVDAVDDGTHAVKQAMKSVEHGVEQIGNLRDEAVHQIKRQPLSAVGLAAGTGAVLGFAAGWLGQRRQAR